MQDGAGLLLMAGYVVLRLGERVLLTPEHVDLPYVSNAAALIGAGLLLGRSLGLAGRIRRALGGPDEVAKRRSPSSPRDVPR